MTSETLSDDISAEVHDQKTRRTKREETPSNLRLNPEQRWDVAAEAAKTQVRLDVSDFFSTIWCSNSHPNGQTARAAANENKNDVRSRWKRAAFVASKLQDSNSVAAKHAGPSTPPPSDQDVKMLETQHWLEMTDSKHRYGSNLKA